MTHQVGTDSLPTILIRYSTSLNCEGPNDVAACQALIPTLPGGLTPREKEILDPHFTKEALNKLAGADGARALAERAKWLADHAQTKLHRFGFAWGSFKEYSNYDRRKMLQELGNMGASAKEFLDLLDEIDDKEKEPDSKVRRRREALARMGGMIVTDLEVSREARFSAMRIDADDPTALLVGILKRDSATWRRPKAALALGETGDTRAIPALFEALRSLEKPFCEGGLSGEEESLRDNIVEALLRIGQRLPAEETLPLFLPVLADNNDRVRAAAARAVGSTGSKNAISALEQALQDEEICEEAALGLAEIGKSAPKDVMPRLIEAMRRNEAIWACFLASEALEKIGVATPQETVPLLIELLPNDMVERLEQEVDMPVLASAALFTLEAIEKSKQSHF